MKCSIPRVAGLAAVVALAATPVPAVAHTEVTSTRPANGGSAKTSLRSVTVTFGGTLRRGTLKVYTASGRKVSIGKGGRDPRNVRRLRTSLASGLGAGRYVARWSAVAADGHGQSGSFGFRLRR